MPLEAVEELLGRTSSREFVLELVRWLDLRMTELEPRPFEHELFVRAFVAAGSLLPEEPPVVRTLEAARAFIADPTSERRDALWEVRRDGECDPIGLAIVAREQVTATRARAS